jgi:sulfur carrier protein
VIQSLADQRRFAPDLENAPGKQALSEMVNFLLNLVRCAGDFMTVKLILRDKEYELKPGMTLLSCLQKIDVLPETVLAASDGELIEEDEILKDGQVVKLVAVISGG